MKSHGCFPELGGCLLFSSHLGPGHKLGSKCPSASRSCPDLNKLKAAVVKETQYNNISCAGDVRAQSFTGVLYVMLDPSVSLLHSFYSWVLQYLPAAAAARFSHSVQLIVVAKRSLKSLLKENGHQTEASTCSHITSKQFCKALV